MTPQTKSTISPSLSLSATSNDSLLLLRLLGDYKLHHSDDDDESTSSTAATSVNHTQHAQPATWPENYRRTPKYRPLNRNLNLEERPGPDTFAARVFVWLMLNGCDVVARVNKLWRNTGGRVNDEFFCYDIGGEW